MILLMHSSVEKSNQAQQEITELREELREAKLEREQKVHYDDLTRALLKKTPKSRTEQIAYKAPRRKFLIIGPSKKLRANWNKCKANCPPTRQFGMPGKAHLTISSITSKCSDEKSRTKRNNRTGRRAWMRAVITRKMKVK